MPGSLPDAPAPRASTLRAAILPLLAGLVGANLLAWGYALFAFHGRPLLLGSAMLAWSLGLRHAVDADHIAAIDNVTRKLMQEGKRPTAAGLFFSLGHSTVVFLAALGIALGASALEGRAPLRALGGLIGTLVSAGFLLTIGIANLFVLVAVARAFRRVRGGETPGEAELEDLLAQRGLMNRLFRRAFGLIRESRHMYPLGFLFGLGFDTASEIGLLALSAAGATQGLSLWSLLVFPTLFAAGMSLIDTLDSALMTGAYGWAFVKPVRRLYYNLTVTFLSVVIAFVVGGAEVLGLVAGRFGLTAGPWALLAGLNSHFGLLGYGIVILFGLAWLAAALVWRLRGYDRLDDPAPE